MLLIECKNKEGDIYTFKSRIRPTKDQFDTFVKKNYPYEVVNGRNILKIVSICDFEEIEEINLK